jgi:peptidoglycan/LPS O-acetylase OafA/YrhL
MSKSSVPSPPHHLLYLDSLRAIAAVYVVFHHAVLSVHGILDTSKHQFLLLAKPFFYGHAAVNLFIVLSGFCLMLPAAKNKYQLSSGATNFFSKRAWRILPTYFLALVISLLLIFLVIDKPKGTIWDNCLPVNNFDIITHLLLIQDLFLESCHKINYVFWSISVEWRIYFLFPLILLAWRKIGPIITTLLAISLPLVLFGTLYAIKAPINLEDNGISLQYIGLFTIGMLACDIAHVYNATRTYPRMSALKLTSSIVTLLFILAWVGCHRLQASEIYFLFGDLIQGVFFALLLVGLSTNSLPRTRKILSYKPLAFVGTFAYSIYLIHAPLLQLFAQFILEPFNLNGNPALVIIFLVGVPLTILGAYLFFSIAERPFIVWRKSRSLLYPTKNRVVETGQLDL